MIAKRFLFLACVFLCIGCQRPIPQRGMWTGTITIGEKKQLPFQLFLDLNSAAPSGYFVNGAEKTLIPEIRLQGDSLSLLYSEYSAAMCGTWNGKQWSGKFFRYRNDTSWNDFASSPREIINGNISSERPVGLPLVGTFQVKSSTANGIDSTTTAKFWIKNDSVYGTFIAPDGDYGLFTGTQVGSTVALTRFTGWQAFLLELERQDTTWTGSLYFRSGKPMVVTLIPQIGVRSEIKSFHKTIIKSQKKPFMFSGTTSTGKLISSEDDLFRRKALVIDIMGTWCHNCMDAAPLLQQLYSEFGKDGLEILGLAFEISNNPEVAKRNLTLFQKRFGITYTMLFCGSTNDANVDLKLKSQLNDFYAYPTTIFIDKKGVVREIHVGFHGPGTGDEYQSQVQQYYEIVKQLLN